MRLVPLLCLALLACPGSPAPQTLWLAQNGSETMVRLVDQQPDPF
jgi:hypothetical protein